ncbi:LOW QUALITY PROTEIN: hypothetical protein SETIT_2G000600v2 [Setaria italica]|uniref:Uncharacterized protein n=1 Tax=Setaria italica TaxID=4555 RepID=A0A368PU17_SETIT|nr:LOW QUALITY PROTEIN: hypothetical protein SETIT_2G000600v2 [Setaria italica]
MMQPHAVERICTPTTCVHRHLTKLFHSVSVRRPALCSPPPHITYQLSHQTQDPTTATTTAATTHPPPVVLAPPELAFVPDDPDGEPPPPPTGEAGASASMVPLPPPVVHVELDGGVGAAHAGRLPEHVPAGHPELSRASHDGELPDVGVRVVPPQHGDGAAVVVPRGEQQVGAHHQRRARLRRQHVDALHPPHRGRRRRRGLGQRVVHHGGVAEGHAQRRGRRRPGALDHLHRRRVAARHDVVHEEAQVRRRAVVGRLCRQQHGEEEEEEDGLGSHGGWMGGCSFGWVVCDVRQICYTCIWRSTELQLQVERKRAPRAADDGELPHVRRDVVAAHHRDGAAVVAPRRQQQVGAHRQHGAPRLRRHHVEALHAADGGGGGRGILGEGIVGDGRVPERQARDGGGALDHLHRCRVASRQDVVHEQVQVRGGAAVSRQDGRRRRHRSEEEEEDGGSEGGSHRCSALMNGCNITGS